MLFVAVQVTFCMVLHLSFSWTVTIVFHDALCNVNLGLSHYGENTDWGWLWTRCWGRFGPTVKEVTECWWKMHENEHHDLYSLPNMDDKIQVAEMCGVCVKWKRSEIHMRFWLENVKERKSLEEPVADLRILKWILRNWHKRLWAARIHVVQEREKWRSLVTTVTKFWFPQKPAEKLFTGFAWGISWS